MVAHPQYCLELTQQRQHSLGNLVGLCQNRSASLLQDLSASHVGDFDSVVGVFNTRTSCGQVVDRVVQVGNRGFKTVLNCTQIAAQTVNSGQCLIKCSQRVRGFGDDFISRIDNVGGFSTKSYDCRRVISSVPVGNSSRCGVPVTIVLNVKVAIVILDNVATIQTSNHFTAKLDCDVSVVHCSALTVFQPMCIGGSKNGCAYAEVVDAQRGAVDGLQIDVNGLTIVRTHLNLHRVDTISQDVYAVELGLSRHTVDFFQALCDFSLDGCQIGIRVGIVSSLNGQFTDALQVVVDFVQCVLHGVSDGDTIVGITRSLGQTLDVGREAVGDGLTGSVVLGAVNAQA